MAGDWIKFEKATLDKPEVFEMAGILGIDPDAVVGKLLRVWDWFDDQSIDGYAPVTLAAQLNRNTGYAGFTEAMQKVGWLATEGGKLMIPNFHRHNGETAKQRALSAKRMAKKRSNSYGDSVTSSVTNPQPEKRREEKRREENKEEKNAGKPLLISRKAGTLDELKSFAKEIGLPESDGESMFHHWESNGWKNGPNAVKNWQAGIRKWKSQGWLPSQKQTNGTSSPKSKNFTSDQVGI